MSRVAVRPSNGDDIEKLAFLAPLAGAVGRKLATSALGQGFTAARGATGVMGKLKAGAKAFGAAKAKNIAGGEDGETDGAAVAAKLAQQSMANQAKARQDRLQNQKEHNMQMADRAKQDSQISTGEPMDLSWRLLKDWSWNPALKWYEIEAIIRRAKQARKKDKHEHLHSQPMKHYHEQFAERYHPHQKMPIEAIGYEPHEIANAMADLYMENHPELKQALDEHLPHPSDPNQTKPPGMVFHALRTNNPKVSDGTTWTDYSPVVGKPATFGQPQLVSVVNTPAGQASNRHTIRVSSRYPYGHSYDQHNETLPSTFNLVPPLSDVEEKPKRKSSYIPAGLVARDYTPEEQKIVDERRAQIEAEAAEKEAAKQAEREAAQAAREQGELKVELVHPAMPGLYSVTDPAFGIVGETYDASMPRYEYYHNHYLNQQNNVQTGEPMDLAWRMLKQMSDEEMQEWAYENLRNQGITIPDEREEEVVPKPEMPTLYY